MKKIYSGLAATIAFIAICGIAFGQTNTFNASLSNSWTNAGNWSLGTAPANNQTIVIPTGLSSFILGTVNLTGVTIKVQAGATLVIGNGNGNGNKGVLTLDATSKISLEGAGNTSSIRSNSLTNSNNVVTIGGTTVFQGNTTYSLNPGSGVGVITGPANAVGAGGFTFGALPVVLVNFQANLSSGKKVAISWTTQQEVNSNNFNVQRSADGLNWTNIATIKAAGFSSVPVNYSFSDAAPAKGANLYRVRINDLDGKIGYTEIKNVRINTLGKFSLFPNPARDFVNISLGDLPTADWTLSLVNNAGQLVLQKKFSKSTTVVNLPLDIYAEGTYTLQINDGATKQSGKLFIAHQ